MVLTPIDWPALIATAMAAQTQPPIIDALEPLETYASGNAPTRYLCSDGQQWVAKWSPNGWIMVAEMFFGLLAEDVGAEAIPRAALIRDPEGRLRSGSLYIGSPGGPGASRWMPTS
jgi:hypothetical protein